MNAKEIRILLVDDDEDEYILLRDLLEDQPFLGKTGEQLRFTLEWSATYQEALRACQMRVHDVYLFDYYLGERNGLDLLRAVRLLGCDAPVLILTGQSTTQVDLAAMESGAADYLPKDGLHSRGLERAIRYALERKAAQDLLQEANEALEQRVRQRTAELQEANRLLSESNQQLAQVNQALRTEISERRRAQEALETSEKRFRSLADTTSAAIFIVQEGTIRYANPAARTITGFEPPDLVGLPFWDLADPQYRTILKKHGLAGGGAIRGLQSDKTAAAGPEPQPEFPARYELKLLRKDGETRWVDLTAGRFEYEGIPAWVVTTFDITERDLAERELRKAKQELEQRVAERTSELREANLRLAQANQRLQTVLQTQPAGIWIVDADGRIIEDNAMAAEIWGRPYRLAQDVAEYRIYRAWRSDTGAPLAPEDWGMARAVRQGKAVISQMLDIERFDGRKATILVSSAPILDAEGEITGAVTVSQDITRQRALERQAQASAEEARRRAEELDAVINAMSEAVIIYDVDGSPRRLNPAAINAFGADLTGASREQIETYFDLRNVNGYPVPSAQLPSTRALQGKTVAGERLMLHNETGQDRTILTSASPLYDAQGKLAGAVAVWTDVTERERLLTELEIEQARLQAVIENAPEGIVVADREARIIMVNATAQRLYNRPVPIGEPYPTHVQLQICYPDGTPYEPRNLPLTRSALDGEIHEDVEMVFRWPDGQWRFMLVNTGPVYDRQGVLSGAVAVFQDITVRKQAEQQMRQSASRAEILATITEAFSLAGLDYEKALETAAQVIAESFGDGCIIRLVTPDQKSLPVVAAHLNDPHLLPLFKETFKNSPVEIDKVPTYQAFQEGEALLMPFVTRQQIREMVNKSYWPLVEAYPIRSLLITPMRAQNHTVGTITILRSRHSTALTADDRLFFQDLADRAALAVENARLYLNQAQRAREMDALQTATAALLTTLDLDNLLSHILDAAVRAVQSSESGLLFLTTIDTGELSVGAEPAFSDGRIRRQSQTGIPAFAQLSLNQQKPVLIGDLLGEPDFQDQAPAGARAAIAAPLLQNDRKLGVLALFSEIPNAFGDNDLRLLNSFAATTATAIQNAALHSQVQRQAKTDALTELLNRRGFSELAEQQLERVRRTDQPLAVMMLDLDHFKRINDTYGHATGDQMLQGLADRLRHNLREVDILGRHGGEEFVIMLPEIGLARAYKIAERLRAAVAAEPFPTDRGDLPVTVSLGVTAVSSRTESLEDLLRQADRALYDAKERGRNRVEIA